ncbi:motility associated factor glycosyltransferase family protein [Planctomycetales bacterium ZRK34]|nr:motility associated factor glycosyltransferase family protein [Planctomycetales bacterium ZRK34]
MSEIFQRNLQVLQAVHPAAADRLTSTAAHPGVAFAPARQDGYQTASLTTEQAGRSITVSLASRHRPFDEASRLADTAELDKHGCIIVMGLGLGYHAALLAERTAGKALMVVYEPDVSLARAVLEQMDHSDWLAKRHVVLLLGEVDDAELTRRFEQHAGVISQGVQFVSHAPTRRLHDQQLKTFTDQFAKLVSYLRTNMATTLVNAAVTCRNLTHNLGHYAAGATVNELAGAAAGFPAVLVSAGPSLARNVQLLAEPGVRDRVVIIAVQTVLKPLLARGIRPHFVTALDYHEISARFYESLPDLPDVTLVAEPKAHPVVLDRYPGPIRVLGNSFLDKLLGPLVRPITPIRAGSTVAHLSLYLAQHLGCDPIIMVGQDLGFSDGLYYCPGTAIDDVWAGELNPFNTLDMMQWQRIARHKSNLQKRVDINERPIYSDEQMLTYLAQFERDFAAAPQTIIDATEGGLPKQHTAPMTLESALACYANRPLPQLPAASIEPDRDRLRQVGDLLTDRIEQVKQFRTVSRKTMPILNNMLRDQRDHAKMNRLFDKLEKHKKRAAELGEVFALVNELNQVGLFNRVRADRAIEADDTGDPYERQRRQLDRDVDNIDWLIQACDETLDIFTGALKRVADQQAEIDEPATVGASERGAA